MFMKLATGFGLAVTAVGLSVVTALAYTGTPGASASATTNSNGTVTFSGQFTGGAGQSVTFSAAGGGSGCTVTFNPATGTTDASGNFSTTATPSSTCSGTISFTAVTGAQNVTTTATVAGLPAASAQQIPLSYPAIWLALLALGLGLIAASVFGINRRQAATA